MPEAIEIKKLSEKLDKELKGKTIGDVKFQHSHPIRSPNKHVDFKMWTLGLHNQTIVSIYPRAKHIVIRLERRKSRWLLTVHMGSTGWLLTDDSDPQRYEFIHDLPDSAQRASFQAGTILVKFIDPRGMGRWKLYKTWDEQKTHLATYDVEVYKPEFTLEYFKKAFQTRRNPPLVAWLEDQHTGGSGIGLWMSNEIMHQAKLHPMTTLQECTEAHQENIYTAIQAALEAGLSKKSKDRFRVFQRKGKPCFSCETPISYVNHVGRGRYFCPQCQRVLRPDPVKPS